MEKRVRCLALTVNPELQAKCPPRESRQMLLHKHQRHESSFFCVMKIFAMAQTLIKIHVLWVDHKIHFNSNPGRADGHLNEKEL